MTDGSRHVNPWIVAIAVMFATFMEVLDTTVVNVSLPHIASSMSATTEEATWALTSYLVANAIILPMTGWLAARFGRKRLLMMSTFGFTMASFLCGIAPNLAMLVIFRIVQGATGGALQPLSQAVLLESFKPEERGRAMGFWGLGIVVAPILGPVVGGWLTENYSWRWVFYINLPVGIVSLFMTRLYVFDPPYLRRETGGIDSWGMGMLVVGVGALQYVLDKGQQDDWFASRLITTLSIVSIVTLVALVIHQLRSRNPIIDLRVFTNRSYAVGVFLMTVLGFVLYGSLVLLPVMLQTLFGYSSLQAGEAMAPRGVGSLIMMPLVGYLTGMFDARKLLTIGLAVGGFTLLWLGEINLDSGFWDLVWPQFLQGAGLALLFVPLTTVSMATIEQHRMGYATSLFNLMRNIGGSVGIALTGTYLQRHRQAVGTQLGEHISVYDPTTQSMFEQIRAGLMAAGTDAVTATQQTYAVLHGMLMTQASMVSFVTLFRVLGVVFLLMIPLVVLMRRPAKGTGAAAAH
ncbi:MAG TPA: DHA2 family efflux MFS transporter permease subunit [Vicinamibacterales bacterium]|nr:DHA2 family efflux MFS transporter permease subunit [Vicinamibacterales bacterium]